MLLLLLNKLYSFKVFLIFNLQYLLFFPNHVCGEMCIYYSEANYYDSCGGCGICYRVSDGKEDLGYKCVYNMTKFLLPQYFNPKSRNRCELSNFCGSEKAKSECKNFPCVPFLAAYKCKCDSTKLGRLCNYEVMPSLSYKDYADVNNVLYSPSFALNEYLTISILFNSLGRNNLEVHVETVLERNIYNMARIEETVFDEEYCKTLYPHHNQLCSNNVFNFKSAKWILNVRLFFPGREFGKNRPYIRLGNSSSFADLSAFSGRVEIVKVFIYSNNDKTPVYNDTFNAANFLSSPQFSSCEPIVTIRQGSDTVFDVIKFAKRNELAIANFYKLTFMYIGGKPVLCFESVKDFMIHWKVWKHEINHDELTTDPIMLKLNVPHIIFNAYSLEIGHYKILNNITLLAHGQAGFSPAYSYFEIVELDLEVSIQGGNKKNVYYKTKFITLNANTSINPNLNLLENNNDLIFEWKCDSKMSGNVKSNLDKSIITYHGPFEINKLYTFTLTVTSKTYKISKTTFQKMLMVPETIPTLDIFCKKNCGFLGFQSNSAEVIYFQVIVSYPNGTKQGSGVESKKQFTWTYGTSEDKSFNLVENIRQPNTPSDILIVLKDSLITGVNYVFRVEGGGDLKGQAEFNIQMAKPLQVNNFSCSLYPPHEDGIFIGYFDYRITCDRLVVDKLSPKYEFYDRYTDREDLGRLITSGNANVAKYVGITRGKLSIEVTDQWGTVVCTFEILREQDFYESPRKTVQNLLDFLDIFHSTVDPEYKANAFSMIGDIISRKKEEFEDGDKIIKSLLARSSEQEIYSYTSMKLWANSVNILADLGLTFGLDSFDVINLSKIVLKLSGHFLSTLKKSYDVLHEFTTREILQVSQMLIDSCNIVYLSRHYDLEKRIIKKEDIYEVYYNYRVSAINMIFTLSELLNIFALRALPYLSPLQVMSENITLWVKEGSPNSFVQFQNHTFNESIPSIEVSRHLASFLRGLSEIVTVKVIVFNGNPFWWNTDLNIITNAVSLEIIKNKNNKHIIEYLNEPVIIHLNSLHSGETIIEGSVQQPDPKGTIDKADNRVNVYKIRVEDRSALRLVFHNLKDGETIRVRHLRNLRPDYDYTISGTVITESNPEYHNVLKEPTSVGTYDLDFLGILPGSEVPIGQWQNYNFSMYIMHCARWDSIHGWSSKACEPKEIHPETKQLVCECKHLSIFAGFATEPLNMFNPFQDFDLFLEVVDNPFVAAFIILLLLSYFPTQSFALWKNYTFRDKQCVIYLEDNLPHDKFPYLIAVFTGSRLLTGTTSNVGIVVEGEDTVSRPHILRSSRFKTLQRGDDNWFIMYTPYYLGKINMIQLWMDYSGRRPEWYLYKIIVIDVNTKEQYNFYINAWLSLRFGNYIERFEKVDYDEELTHMDLFDEDLAFGFREAHLWFSVFATHPRSALNRSERLSVAFCALFVVMLVSCIFYGVLDSQEERSEFGITRKQMIVGAIGWFVVVIFIGLIVTILRASLRVRHSHAPRLKNARKRHNLLLRLCHPFQKWFLGKKKFVPVHCGKDIVRSEKFMKTYTNPNYTYFAWYFCISVILVCSIFIVMYAMKFGKVRCLEWLSSIVLSLVQDIFLVSPLKIMLFTAISVMMYSTIYDVNTYDIDWKRVKIYKKRLLDADPEIEVKLVTARSKKVYIPLSYKEVMAKQARQDLFDALWMLLDILVIALLAIMLIIQSNTLWTTKFYWNNYEVVSLLKRGFKGEGYEDGEMNNVTNYLPTLKKNVFPLIYQTQWYNGQPLRECDSRLSSSSYTFDGTATLFGVPRIRQLRLKPGLCENPIYNGLPNVCPSIVTEETQDTEIYSEGWKSSGRFDSFQRSSVWDYRNARETFDQEVFGFSGLEYEAGGYVADLGLTHDDSDKIIHYLEIEKWLDRRTAAILLEMTIYNPNAGTLSWLIAVTERLHIGILINKIYVYTADQKYNVFLIDIIVFISMSAFAVRLILVLNRRGIKHLFFDFWNRFEIMIVLLNIYCGLLYIKNVRNTKKYLDQFNDSELDLYFKFLNLVDILTDIELVFVVLFVMVMCRFMKSWRFGEVFNRLFFTLWSPWKFLIWVFILIFLLIFVYWKKICYLLNEFLVSRTFFILINKLNFKHTIRNCHLPSCKVSLYISCTVTNCLLLMVVIHYLWSYRTIKNRAVDEDEINLCSVFSQKVERNSYIVHRH